MKVLFVHDGPIFGDQFGNYYGVDFNTSIKNKYLQMGESLSFLTRVNNIEEISGLKLSNIDIDSFIVIKVPEIKSPMNFFRNRTLAKSIIKRAVDEHDIIIVRLPSAISIIAVNYAQKCKKPLLVELVGCPWDGYSHHSFLGKIISPYMWFSTRLAVKNSSHVLYVTEKFLQKRYPSDGISAGISDVELQPADEKHLKKRLEKINCMSDKSMILGTIGSIDIKYKGQLNVIKALSRLNINGFDLQYQLVGAGNPAFLKRMAEKYGIDNRVTFLGSIPHEKVFNWLDDIDIYIQPSDQEGLPRALVEAMSRACPCVGSNAGGIPELLENEFIFPRGNVSHLYKIMANFSKSKLASQAIRNFHFSKKFDRDFLERKRNSFYGSFLEGIILVD